MSSRLGPDSSIHQTLSWIATLILANLIFVGLAVPVFTAGPGLLVTALVCARLIDSESTAILPALRSALGGAGVAASLLFLGEIAFALLLGWEWMVFSSLADPILRFVAQAVLVFVAVLLLLLHVCLWPMMAQRLREKGRISVTELPMLLRAALLVSIGKLPRSILAIAVAIGPLALAAVSLPWLIRVGFWFLLFGVAFSMYVCVLATHPVLVSSDSRTQD